MKEEIGKKIKRIKKDLGELQLICQTHNPIHAPDQI